MESPPEPFFATPKEAALWWVGQGVPVVPTRPELVDDGRGKKGPRPYDNWQQVPDGAPHAPGRLVDAAEVEAFWESCPEAQVAIVLGNGLGCIDVDLKNLGPEGADPARPIPKRFPSGFAETTKSGGDHLLFRFSVALPPGEPTRAVHLGGYVDVLCGGLLFTAPSRYRNSPRGYEVSQWGEIPRFESVYLALCASAQWLGDEWRAQRTSRRPRAGSKDPASVRLGPSVHDASLATKVEHAVAALRADPELSAVFHSGAKKPSGDVDRSLTEWKIAAFLKRRGVAPSVAWEVVQACEHTKSPRDRRGTRYFLDEIWSRLEAPAPLPEDPPSESPATDNFHLTEFGNADRLLSAFGKDVHFDVARGEWLVWDERRWVIDQTGVVSRYVEAIVEEVRRYGEALPSDTDAQREARGAWLRWWKASSTDSRVRSVKSVASARAGVSVLGDQLDSDPWLLNCLNGTVDLRTGELQRHSRGDLITRLCPVDYRPEAACPTWETFLSQAMLGSTELVAFLHRACGYSLTGLTTEQKFFILHGAGRNGKSTFLNGLRMVLGDYARNSEGQTFLRQDTRHVRQDLAVLQGVRFCSTSEIEDGEQLDEDLVKRLTGGDPVTARYLYSRREVEFTPELKLWMAVNHRPQIRGQDDGIWRRVVMVPWRWQIPESEVDPHFIARLSDEKEGILAWMVRGCQDYRRLGTLSLPPEISDATSDYRSDSDFLHDFLEDCTLDSPDHSATVGDLYRCYVAWSRDLGIKPVSSRYLTIRLKERGRKQTRTKAARYWDGIWFTDSALPLVSRPVREEWGSSYR